MKTDQDMNLSETLLWLPGKTSEQGQKWLPAWRHMLDTAQIMRRLVLEWLPGHIENSVFPFLPAEEAGTEFMRLAVFLAGVHDIGKLTPVFASKLLSLMPGLGERQELSGLGIPSYKSLLDPQRTPHAYAGAFCLRKMGCPWSVVSIVGAHHGKPLSDEQTRAVRHEVSPYPEHFSGNSGETGRKLWDDVRREWLAFMLQYSGYHQISDLPEVSVPAQMLLTGLIIVADWIASNTEYYPLMDADEMPTAEEMPRRTFAAWNKIALPGPWQPDWSGSDGDEFEQRFGFAPNQVQKAVMDVVNTVDRPGMIILEAPMGIGKTEAALATAEKLAARFQLGGLYFGLPTQATANGIFDRISQWGQHQSDCANLSVRLAHGMALMNEAYASLFRGKATDIEQDAENHLFRHPWLEGRKQALLANFTVGTVDQLLMSALKQKHVMLRHIGMAGKIVIVDECHAYDAYMNVYLEAALSWLGAERVPVILLSATLPPDRRQALLGAYLSYAGKPDGEAVAVCGYPGITWTNGNHIFTKSLNLQKKQAVRITSTNESELDALLRDRLSGGGCGLVIVNTVASAQRISRELKNRMPGFTVLTAHSLFTAADRANWEKTITERLGRNSTPVVRDKFIVVGTQVLEQSLDIDADILVTELCPMDLLLQRIGRLHRHARVRPEKVDEAECHILDLPDSGTEFLYGEWLLRQTGRMLPEKILLPDDIPGLVAAAYAVPEDTAQAAWKAHMDRQLSKQQGAKTFRIPLPKEDPKRPFRNTINQLLDADLSDDERIGEAQVRDGEATIEVLLMRCSKTFDEAGFFPWQGYDAPVKMTCCPDAETARKIARQRIRLPRRLTGYTPADVSQTIAQLEQITLQRVPEWLNQDLLKDELFLFLDEKANETLLNGCRVCYNLDYGLMTEKTIPGD